jgi:hypothetical protein
VFDEMIVDQVFKEIPSQQACFQIMIKSLIGKTLMLWVQFGDFVADIKLKVEHMQWILVDQHQYVCMETNQ